MTVRFFLTSSILHIPWIWMNVFNLKKLSKNIAWEYQLIWIRWSKLSLFFKREEDSRLILNLPFLKCDSFFVSKTSQFEWTMLVVTRCYGERLPHIFLPSLSWLRKSCTSESCPFLHHTEMWFNVMNSTRQLQCENVLMRMGKVTLLCLFVLFYFGGFFRRQQ